MSLDRKKVDRTAAEHIRQLQDTGGRLTDADKRDIRRMHERMAEKVARRADGRR